MFRTETEPELLFTKQLMTNYEIKPRNRLNRFYVYISYFMASPGSDLNIYLSCFLYREKVYWSFFGKNGETAINE